jgi:K+-transporting ATPase KdpF subunit
MEASMIFDDALAGVVTAGLMIYLVYALLRPEHL